MLNSPFDKIYSTYYQVLLHSVVLLLRRSRFLEINLKWFHVCALQ